MALFTAVASYVADWNETHIYNPNWPPHAKFHNGQTMAMGALLGLATLYFLWRRRGAPSTNLLSAGILLGLYWVSQMGAFLFSGVGYTDPEFVGPEGLAAVPPQLVVEYVVLALIAVGLLLLRPSTVPAARRPAGEPKWRCWCALLIEDLPSTDHYAVLGAYAGNPTQYRQDLLPSISCLPVPRPVARAVRIAVRTAAGRRLVRRAVGVPSPPPFCSPLTPCCGGGTMPRPKARGCLQNANVRRPPELPPG